MAMCLVWANRAYEKMKAKKNMFKKKAEDLYMRGEDEEMAALMPDYYAGKFKAGYDPGPKDKREQTGQKSEF